MPVLSPSVALVALVAASHVVVLAGCEDEVMWMVEDGSTSSLNISAFFKHVVCSSHCKTLNPANKVHLLKISLAKSFVPHAIRMVTSSGFPLFASCFIHAAPQRIHCPYSICTLRPLRSPFIPLSIFFHAFFPQLATFFRPLFSPSSFSPLSILSRTSSWGRGSVTT